MSERPTSQGYFLGEQLRRFRSALDLPLRAVAAEFGWSESKLSRHESGKRKMSVADLTKLLDYYQVEPEQREYLLGLCAQQESRQVGWWRERRDHIEGNVPQIVALESVAHKLRTVEPVLIPGLLQTPRYAQAALRYGREGVGVWRETDLRIARKRRLHNGELHAEFLIGQTAFDLIPPSAREDQLNHLLEMAELPTVTIRMIPRYEIAYVTHGGPLVLLEFPDEGIPDVAYVEHWAAGWVVDDPVELDKMRMRYDMIDKVSLAEPDTIAWISGNSGV